MWGNVNNVMDEVVKEKIIAIKLTIYLCRVVSAIHKN